MSMLVVVTENVPPRLRGRPGCLATGDRAGVYVGDIFWPRSRDDMATNLSVLAQEGNVAMAWATNTESI